MTARFAFCNDCDLMTRAGFEEVHGYLDRLGLPAGDSFWLFDPSGGEMALFQHDVDHPGPHHHWLLDQVASGTLDVLHSTGSYGERFNRGFRPDRSQVERALEYLAAHARVPRIWSNHGDQFNTQNIGGEMPSPHHQGDVPGTSSYCLDLLAAHGVKYFWLDRLLMRDAGPVRITADEQCRDGRAIVSFVRYLSPAIEWAANAQNFDRQLPPSDLATLAAHRQDAILYTHWGCHHVDRHAVTPTPPVLPSSSRAALEAFATTARQLDLTVVRLETLLDDNAQRPVNAEVDRIGRIIVESEENNADPFYYNQFHKHGLEYFQRRIDGLGVSGHRALDAGAGVGQWSYALRSHFDEVHAIEINSAALKHVARLTRSMRWPRGPVFSRGSIESLPYGDRVFDLIFCYGVLFVTAVRKSLTEFRRVLAPEGRAYICLNGDGWYEYLCDDRFRDRPAEGVLPFAQPLWNALVARAGGETVFNTWCRAQLSSESASLWNDRSALRERFANLLEPSAGEAAAIVRGYSDRVVDLLGTLTRQHLDALTRADRRTSARLARLVGWRSGGADPSADVFPLSGIGSTNRPFTPAEFAALGARTGFRMTAHGPDAALSTDARVTPIYDGTFNGHDSVWECMLAAS
jgi:SAM-dependent methyltransferase